MSMPTLRASELTMPVAAPGRTTLPRPPAWAVFYSLLHKIPANAKWKQRALRSLVEIGVRRGQPFPWRMKNGFVLAISPLEGTVSFQTVSWTCFKTGEWEPNIELCLRRLIKPGMVAYDIGANLGYFTVVMAACAGRNGSVVAFEPVPSAFARLRSCIEWNGLTNVRLLPLALGAINGQASIYVHETATGNASFYRDPVARLSKPQQVEARTLDSLLSDRAIPAPDVIKIDIEGHEMAVLRGATELLRRCKPILLLELNERMSRLARWNWQDLQELLHACGDYTFFTADGSFSPISLERFEVAKNMHSDVIAAPRTSMNKLF